MTAFEISRIANGRPATSGWMARCPAHDDRAPSLSIKEGHDGRTLLRCFAGCELEAITSALGLTLSALFASDASVRDRRPSRVTADDIEQSLQAELTRIAAEESDRTGFAVAELTRHRNEARAIIERRFDVVLKRERALWFEIEPHAVDPLWETCIDQALHIAAATVGLSVDQIRTLIGNMPRLSHRILLTARRLQRELAAEAA